MVHLGIGVRGVVGMDGDADAGGWDRHHGADRDGGRVHHCAGPLGEHPRGSATGIRQQGDKFVPPARRAVLRTDSVSAAARSFR